ncbi:MAG: DUF1501 domain-containing protein [Paludisphaera borealis]|uniref:DUF1501 domain-containing protein n=1 Tax=Paludisphaera borealis TaxID=1387353 RepID=UPI00283F46DC|nr:DUF1501 domain-containing protein [Paludisphaera borealis]MDR3618772.1 DUF1501 domain-containing protein [Paludisphaera borealis]
MASRTGRTSEEQPRHPQMTRRLAVQAGAVGLLGLGIEHLGALRTMGGPATPKGRDDRAVIYIFLSGGLSQLDSFDLKPDAPAEIRGEFRPIATRTPGLSICEHLPKLAERSGLWSLVRSLTHSSNDHSAGHHIMLSGRSDLPSGFDPTKPRPSDWPSIASIAGALCPPRNNLPPAVVLPEKLIHSTGRAIPGQFGGEMGAKHDPWFIEASPFDPTAYGAYPTYEFDHQQRPPAGAKTKRFQTPSLGLPEGFSESRLAGRLGLLATLDRQRSALENSAAAGGFDDERQGAVSLLTDRKVKQAFDVLHAPDAVLDRYGRHTFGWSLLMAKRLVEAGVKLVQVNLGNNETWDNHGNIFPHLKDKLFPPTDQAVSALLDDLNASGLLDSTLVVMAGEFGRTPKISRLAEFYKLPGRDHWGPAQSVLLAGGGVQGGRVIGSTDKIGGYPRSDPHTPENFAATIYNALGLPSNVSWRDPQDRPHFVYHGEPITALM